MTVKEAERAYRIARAEYLKAGDEWSRTRTPASHKRYLAAKRAYHSTGETLFRLNG